MRLKPHPYQLRGAKTIIRHERAGLLFDPGLGKTATTLLAINGLKRAGLVNSVLVVAPLRVIHSVWPQQIEHWDQFNDLRISIVHGTKRERVKALEADADIYAVNPEGIVWLAEKELNCDMLVVDESTRFKNHQAKCWKALASMLPRFKRRVILTGTPSPNGIKDLWTQMFILDDGERLGKRITHFLTRYFYKGGFRGHEWIPFVTSSAAVESKIADIVLRLDAKDYLDLPELIVNDVVVELPEDIRKAYRKLEKDLFFALADAEDKQLEVQTYSAGAKYLLCRQVANGGLYDENKTSQMVHSAKIEALDSIVEELQGKPCMVVYQFKHDLDRLNQWRKAPHIGGGVAPKVVNTLIEQWNAGKLPLLYVQPQSMSHGLNMQGAGNDIVWFGLTDNLETYLQTNARIYRQGVRNSVRVHRILAKGTVDLAMVKRIDQKAGDQMTILESLRQYAKEAERGIDQE